MTTLYLVRHARTDWNDEGRHQGQADPPLNEQGMREAQEMALALRGVPFDAIYSSDLKRARQTAQPLADLVGLPVRLDARLREINQGKWEGLRVAEIQAGYPELFAQWSSAPLEVRLPDGETLRELEARVVAALDDIAAAHPGRTVAVFTHGLAITAAHCRVQGASLERFWEMIPRNAAWEVVEWPVAA